MTINYEARYSALKVLLKDLIGSCEDHCVSYDYSAVPVQAVSYAEQRLKEIERGSLERFFKENSHE